MIDVFGLTNSPNLLYFDDSTLEQRTDLVFITNVNTFPLDPDMVIGNNSGIDDDHDGIPNDIETANGLNPLNGVDAAQDADGDGISNLDEYLGNTPIVDSPPPETTSPGDATNNIPATTSSSEGGCSIQQNGSLDPTLPILVLCSLLYILRLRTLLLNKTLMLRQEINFSIN